MLIYSYSLFSISDNQRVMYAYKGICNLLIFRLLLIMLNI